MNGGRRLSIFHYFCLVCKRTGHWSSCKDISTYYTTHARINKLRLFLPRITSGHERAHLFRYIKDMLDCNCEALPKETMLDNFMTLTSAMAKYRSCMPPLAPQCTKVHPCGQTVDETSERHCSEIRDIAATLMEQQQQQRQQENATRVSTESVLPVLEKRLQEHGINITTAVSKSLKTIVNRLKCFNEFEKPLRKCLPLASQECSKRKLRVLEVNRMKMEDMELLLHEIPDLYVLYYTRDPRGIALSRSQIWWHARVVDKDRRPVTEARYLCPRMERDVEEFPRLLEKYPGVFYHIRYENFVRDPVKTAASIYGLFNMTSPVKWTEANMKVHGRSSNKWLLKIPHLQLKDMDDICRVVLQKLGYDLYEDIVKRKSLQLYKKLN